MLHNDRATDILSQRPNCSFCGLPPVPATVDGKTTLGPWAYMCENHFDKVGVGLGMGLGQVLLCSDDRDEHLLVKYNLTLSGSERGGGSCR